MPDQPEHHEVAARYREMLAAWNAKDARAFAAQFSETADVVGFDGSQMNGRNEIEAELRRIFADHVTSSYVSSIRSVRQLDPDVAILHAVVGMVPPGKSELNPAVNAIQIMVAHRSGGRWEIECLQNTPAAFHGRPELTRKLTQELTAVLRSGSPG